jgi:hypothetical protein
MPNKPHNPDDIKQLMDVAEGRSEGHLFISDLDTPALVFRRHGEPFGPDDITFAERFFSQLCEEPVVYDGLLDPSVARAKALEMVSQNAVSHAGD